MWRLFIFLLLLLLKSVKLIRVPVEDQLATSSDLEFNELLEMVRNSSSSDQETLNYISKSPLHMALDPLTGKYMVMSGNTSSNLGMVNWPDVEVVNSNLAPVKTNGPPEFVFSNPSAPNVQNLKITIKLPNHPVVEKLNNYLNTKPTMKIRKVKTKKIRPVRFLPSSSDFEELPSFKTGNAKVQYFKYPIPRSKTVKSNQDLIVVDDPEKFSKRNQMILKRITDPDTITFLKNKQEEHFRQDLMNNFKILSVPNRDLTVPKRNPKKHRHRIIPDSHPNSSHRYHSHYRMPLNRNRMKKPHFRQQTTTEMSTQGDKPQKNKNMVTENPLDKSVIMQLTKKIPKVSTDSPNIVHSEPKLAANIIKDLENAVTIEKAKVHVLNDPEDAPTVIKETLTTTSSPQTTVRMSQIVTTDSSASFDEWRPIIYNRTEFVHEFYYPVNNNGSELEKGGNSEVNGTETQNGYVYDKGEKKFEEGASFLYDQVKADSEVSEQSNFGDRLNDTQKSEFGGSPIPKDNQYNIIEVGDGCM